MKHVREAMVGFLLVSAAVVGSPSAAAGPAPTAALCESGTNPGHAVYLTAVVDRAAAVLPDGAAIGFYDRVTDTTCYVNPDRRLNTASIVKVLIATALQWRAQQDGRPLEQQEVDTATTMITSADATASNKAANELWRQLRLEQPYVREVLDIMGLFGTTPSPTGEWGLSETTARDQVILLRVLTSPDEVFLERERRD